MLNEQIKKYILSIDQSTSATKVILFDHKARLVNRVSIQHRQIYPKPGFVEHDPREIYDNVIRGIKEIIEKTKVETSEIACLSITNQRETALIWDRNSGEPVANAAVWQCQRGADICSNLKKLGYGRMIADKTGLVIDSYFSASKLKWIINNTPGVKERAERGDLLFGTMDTWLLWKLTDGKIHSTDYSNACRTMLFNISTLQWDEELIRLFDLYPSMFPDVKFSDMVFGDAAPVLGFNTSLPIAGLIGDSHGALFGQHCFLTGTTKATYGTGSSIMMNIGKSPREAPEGMVTSIGFSRNKSIDYVFEGNIHCTGDTINWLVNELQLINSTDEAEQIAGSVKDNGGVYLVPAFVGLGAPYWNHEARASVSGMSRDTTKAHIVRAALESIAYQVKDIIDIMIQKAGIELRELRVDGGPTRNDFLMQFQTDILQKTVVRSGIEEISALGSAMMAGLATGFWKDIEEIGKLRTVDKTFHNNMQCNEIERLYSGWKLAVRRTLLK